MVLIQFQWRGQWTESYEISKSAQQEAKRMQQEEMRRATIPPSSLDRDEAGSSATRNLNQQQQQQRHYSHATTSKRSIISSLVYLIISFACGYCVGKYDGNIISKPTSKAFVASPPTARHEAVVIDSTTTRTVQERKTSQVIRLNDVPLKSTSHVDAQGRPITKQQLVDPFVLVNNLAGISVTSLLPGQSVTRHSHESMHEFFYILDGQCLVQLDIPNNSNNEGDIISASSSSSVSSSSWLSVSKGSLVYAAERQAHAFHVPENASQPMQMIFFGLTTNH